MTVEFWAGWVYFLVGIISGISIWVGLITHEEHCDRCILGSRISDHWASCTLSTKIMWVLAIGAMLIWPLMIAFSIIVILPMIIYERYAMRIETLSPPDIFRSWFKCNRRDERWNIYPKDDSMIVYLPDGHGAQIAEISCNQNGITKLTYFSTERKEEIKYYHIGDPKYFRVVREFMRKVEKEQPRVSEYV